MSKDAQSLLEEFGAAVLRARSLRGWQLKDLSNAMGGTSGISFLSDIEKGKRSISSPTVGKLITALQLEEGWMDRFLGSDTTEETEVTQADRVADAALEQSEASGAAKRLRAAGITENALIGLAQRVAADTEDLKQAWTELQNAMEMAVRVQADGKVTSNHGDFVDVVLKRVAELSAEGEYESAGEEIDAALAREVEETQARQGKLLDRGVEVALLDRDTERAAELLVRKADLETGGRTNFDDLRSLFTKYWEHGRDKGINLELELAIDLAKSIQPRAEGCGELGNSLNDLGNALSTLGERERETARAEEAVIAYKAALNERTRERVPLDWAMTQNNLGNVLQILGQRDSGTARLEEAVIAYKSALEERTRDKVPLDWAMTHNNLAAALRCLGERESGTARLEEAANAYKAALEERTRDKMPLDWAMTQNNLGIALTAIGVRENDTGRLVEAVNASKAALKERTRDKVPFDWAMTQNTLGTALSALGARESGIARLDEAIVAYDKALEELTRDKAPLDWAFTQGNLALVEIAFFDKTGAVDHLDRAEAYASAAREVFLDGGAEHFVGMADEVIAAIQERQSAA